MRARDLDRHVAELCREHQIRRIVKPGRGRARVNQRVIRHPPIELRDPMTYLVALHEIRHVQIGLVENRLTREAECWRYALENSRIPVDFRLRQRISACLVRYLYRAKANGWAIPKDGTHPFWCLMRWWEATTPLWVVGPDAPRPRRGSSRHSHRTNRRA